MSKPQDYLEVDSPIPGQNFVCLSFISPEHVLKNKDRFFASEYVNSLEADEDGFVKIKPADFANNFEDYLVVKSNDLEEKFHKENDFQTTVRGVKIRGVYNSQDEASKRAGELQRLDRNFNVYVGQIGYWLPWDANPSDVAENEYMEKELNDLMKQYKSNQIKKDVFYQNQIEETKKAAAIEAERQKADNAASEAMNALGIVEEGTEESKEKSKEESKEESKQE
jgi:hypothetical protein